MRVHLAVLGAVILIATLTPAFSTAGAVEDESLNINVEIVNKAKLPPERLADALYAKAVLTDKRELLREAAKLNPKDPVYLYRLVPLLSGDEIPQEAMKKARKALDQVLAVDPNYLPALYRQAKLQPTPDEQIKALELIAGIDKDNAKPYYLMAVVRYRAINKGRRIAPESGDIAFSMTAQEWASVEDFIKLGNNRPLLRSTAARVPSVEDIRVAVNGKIMPGSMVEPLIQMVLVGDMTASFEDWPGGLGFEVNASMRQLARQAKWEAEIDAKAGRIDDAIDTLEAIRTASKKWAASPPHWIMVFLTAKALHNISVETEIGILKDTDQKAKLEELQREKADWQLVSDKSSELMKEMERKKAVPPFDKMNYFDRDTEEAGMAKILTEFGLIK